MKVTMTFDITPQEALELLQGTNHMITEDMRAQVNKVMQESATAAYKEATGTLMDPMAWWTKKD